MMVDYWWRRRNLIMRQQEILDGVGKAVPYCLSVSTKGFEVSKAYFTIQADDKLEDGCICDPCRKLPQ